LTQPGLEFIFNDSVFQRMKSYDGYSASSAQGIESLIQSFVQYLQLSVDSNSQGLKGSFGRVRPFSAGCAGTAFLMISTNRPVVRIGSLFLSSPINLAILEAHFSSPYSSIIWLISSNSRY
jgi:hypothetical protein